MNHKWISNYAFNYCCLSVWWNGVVQAVRERERDNVKETYKDAVGLRGGE